MSEILAVLMLFVIAVVWFGLPFVPTMREIRNRSEGRPLIVDRDNDGEVRHFAKKFKSYLEANFQAPALGDAVAAGARSEGRMSDGTPYRVLAAYDDELSRPSGASRSISGIIVFSRDVVLPERLNFVHGVYAAVNIECGSETLIRSLYGESDVRLGERTAVSRWIHAGNELTAAAGSILYGRASAELAMYIGGGVEFERLHSRKVVFEGKQQGSPPQQPAGILCETEPQGAKQMAQSCYLIEGDWNVAPRSQIRGNFIVHGNVRIGRDSRVEGSLKSHLDMMIGGGSVIEGSLVSTRDLEIGRNCRVRGPAVASRRLKLRADCRVGIESVLTSAIAPSIDVEGGVVVFGTIWARERGRTGG